MARSDGTAGGAEEDSDSEALTWGTERDTTHVEAPVTAEPAETPPDEASPASGRSSALLVVYGIFAGIFLLYVVGWVIAVQSVSIVDAGILGQVLDRIAQFLAFLSPVLWFFGVLMLVPAAKARVRILWLVLGVLMLAPWPFILGF